MIALPLVLLLQAQAPVLAFPEPDLDDTTAYQGYRTRFYRDSHGNTVQIYLEPRGGRVVHLWADAADESLAFTVRETARADGARAAPLSWAADSAEAADSGGLRTLEYRLAVESPRVRIGWFLLGSMRVERDFQYARAHLRPSPRSSAIRSSPRSSSGSRRRPARAAGDRPGPGGSSGRCAGWSS